jgi:tripartite-type tricarboxylate transporter receptor subunit TctC
LFAPAKTPPQILSFLQAKVRQALAVAELRDYLQAAGYEPIGSTPSEFREYLRKDFDKWSEIIRIAKIPRK